MFCFQLCDRQIGSGISRCFQIGADLEGQLNSGSGVAFGWNNGHFKRKKRLAFEKNMIETGNHFKLEIFLTWNYIKFHLTD